MDIYLETDRLTLRRFTADDADLLIELDSDPAVMRYLSGGEATAPEIVRERHLPFIIAGYEKWDGRLGLFAAHEKGGGAFIGWFCLRPERDGPRDEAELGYRLRQAAWGKGYATEGSRALLHKGFTELGVRTIWAETMTVNRGSRKVMEKLGMTLKGNIPTPPDMQLVEGAEHGGVRYEITGERWAHHPIAAPSASPIRSRR
ncbi:GNAT family N-acetyltransferase [Streptomyces sp. LaBMicrA B280]|uniref:GNAT family N-acetyltransferase n=1 Tax=Streptomyces sp. LaBMicrA B280 TaxID=3391001 RepID=UPI003BA51807